MTHAPDPHATVSRLVTELTRRESRWSAGSYLVPRCVVEPLADCELVDIGNPCAFFVAILTRLLARDRRPGRQQPLRDDDVVYLTFMRTFAALNGEIGTPLKQIAFLPVLHRLRVTRLISLPTGRIGQASRKGERGSPFAITDPFDTDESFRDPLLPDVDPTFQYRAMIAAYQLAGIRCGSIIPLTTLALDSPLIGLFPELTYWWRQTVDTNLRASPAGANTAVGEPDVVTEINADIVASFAAPPSRGSLQTVDHRGAKHWQTADGLTPASACPDVVGDDTDTYSWGDVVAIRFDDAIAPRLGESAPDAGADSRSVQITALAIAWRAAILGERLFWVDVAARLPEAVLRLGAALANAWTVQSECLCRMLSAGADPASVDILLDGVVAEARAAQTQTEHGVEFIAEELFSFAPTSSAYLAVVGPWIFCVAPFTHDLDTLRESTRYHLACLERRPPDAPFLVGLGDHDAIPPAPEMALALLVVGLLIPGGLPLIFSGHEYGAQQYVNREFGFNTTARLRALRRSIGESELALFNDIPVDWDQLSNPTPFIDTIDRLLGLRQLVRARHLIRLQLLTSSPSPDVISYARTRPTGDAGRLTVHANLSATHTHDLRFDRPGELMLVTRETVADRRARSITLAPRDAIVRLEGPVGRVRR